MTRAADTAPGAVELKACPFCGEALARNANRASVLSHPMSYAASNCIARFIHIEGGDSKSITAWNTRTPTPSVATGEIVETLVSRAREYEAAVRLGGEFPPFAERRLDAARSNLRAAFEQQAATIAELEAQVRQLQVKL